MNMKKKLLGSILVIAVVFSLVGCGSLDERQISGDVKNNEQKTTIDQSSNNTKEDNKNVEAGKSGYVFKVKETEVPIGAEAMKILEDLGAPLSKYESPSCAFGDLDVMYTYSGYEVDTYQLKGVDYISAVILQDDSVSTPEGLYIGESADKVEEIYGKPTSQNGENKIYTGNDMKLVVIIKNGTVASIQYLNLMLD